MQTQLFTDIQKTVEVRCISLWQPWASLMACGFKFVETRHWPTHIRGKVYIHASKTKQGIRELLEEEDDRILSPMEEALKMAPVYWEGDLPFGKLLAVGELIDCIGANAALDKWPDQEPFGNFGPRRFGHVYSELKAIEPIDYRGAQGFFKANIPIFSEQLAENDER